MKLAILGYGKMGHEIERIAISRGHEIVLIIDVNNQHDFTKENLRKADVVIDFSIPSSAVSNIKNCFLAEVPIVCGTTGWNKDLPEMSKLCKEQNQSLFHSSNFSPGVNILFAVNEYLAEVLNNFPQYDVRMEEIHHTQKLDTPSGTAISIAEQIISRLDRKIAWSLAPEHSENSISIKAIREGDVKGIHEVVYESEEDYISLKHFAKSRIGFASGAVLAAEFLKGKKGVFTMRDILGI